jgi:hypothetical protein
MEDGKDIFQIKKNFTALALFLLVALVLIDVILHTDPLLLGSHSEPRALSAVENYHQFKDGSSYYIYTIFESNGDVYQCWWDEKTWNQKKVTNYRGPTLPETPRAGTR